MYELPYGYCGIMCALCNRHIVSGPSGCAGCSHDGYYSKPCKIAKCCKNKKLLHCALCADFPCNQVKKTGDFSDLNTGEHFAKVCHSISENGFDRWYQTYRERKMLLTMALEKYNNGRMKTYLCELFMRESLQTLRDIMQKADNLAGTQKEISKGFQRIVECCQNNPLACDK